MTELFIHTVNSGEKKLIPFVAQRRTTMDLHEMNPFHETFIAQGNFGTLSYEKFQFPIGMFYLIHINANTDIHIQSVTDSENISLVYCEEGYAEIHTPGNAPQLIVKTQFSMVYSQSGKSHNTQIRPANNECFLFIIILQLYTPPEENILLLLIKNYFSKFASVEKTIGVFSSTLDFLKSISVIRLEILNRTPDIHMIEVNVNLLFMEAIQHLEQQRSGDNYGEGWDPEKQAVYIMAENIILGMDEPFLINNFARDQHLNPNKLKILFKKHMGMPVVAFRISVRMQKAKQLLEETNLSIQEISTLVGYSNPAQFSTMFKKKMGYTPHQLRKD
jgi:AraC-like DNA-binding protein